MDGIRQLRSKVEMLGELEDSRERYIESTEKWRKRLKYITNTV